MDTIAELFYVSAYKYPNKKAICCDRKEMTFSEFEVLVNKYSNYLLSKGVKYGDIIGNPMNNSIESVALIIASACIGVGLLPINPTLPENAIKKAFDVCNVKHVIARKSFWEKIGTNNIDKYYCNLCLDGKISNIDSFDSVLSASGKKPDTKHITGKETFILIMTSGSTGMPKPIELTQNDKIKRAFKHIQLYNLRTSDRILAGTPLYHSLAERLVIMPLLIGATSIILPRFTPDLWLRCINDQKVTFTIAVSAQLRQIAKLLSSPFKPNITSLRSVVSSSELLEKHVKLELIEKLECDFFEMYGTSETSTITSIKFSEASHKKESVGKPIEGNTIKIMERDGSKIVDNKVIGEIVCQNDTLFTGYYRQPEMTDLAFTEDGYFKTGDLGYVDEDGYLYFCGRIKDLIITGGINVYPYDIEQCVMNLPEISECAAFSYPDDHLGEVVALAVVLNSKTKVTTRMIQVHCAKNLADFQQPHYIFVLDELPKNTMGKIVKSMIFEKVQIEKVKNLKS